ncbi:MAG: phosphatase PAP2 family protein [bacterium]|nr:phosphatase PAP2 family protein [bacterium]MDY2830227.1 phosphatase PAP2 family protein [Alphaproteobacteria bacterium]
MAKTLSEKNFDNISLILASIIFLLLGILLASYDLKISSLFFEDGFHFFKGSPFVNFIDKGAEITVVLLYGYTGIEWLRYKLNRITFMTSAKFYFVTFCLGFWCFLIPYGIKNFFGRARPSQITNFGGGSTFSKAFEISNQCSADCSFISGHVAAVSWLIAFCLILPRKYRTPALIAAALIICCTAISRIMGGYHFISDVYFGAYIVIIGILSSYYLLFRNVTNA